MERGPTENIVPKAPAPATNNDRLIIVQQATPTKAPLSEGSSKESKEKAHLSVDDSDEASGHERKKGLLARIRKMRGWFSFSMVLLIGIIILGPAVYVIIMDIHQQDKHLPSLDLNIPRSVLVSTPSLVARWSIFLACCWTVHGLLHFVLDLLPFVIVSAIVFVFARCSERVRNKLHSAMVLKPWIHTALTGVFAVIFFHFLFYQRGIGELLIKEWQDYFNALLTLAIFAVALLVQRFVVYNIAYNFHQVAYQDRIEESKKALLVLENLRKAIREFGLARVFETAQVSVSDLIHRQEQTNQPEKKRSWFNFKKKNGENDQDSHNIDIPSIEVEKGQEMDDGASTLRRRGTVKSLSSTAEERTATMTKQMSSTLHHMGRNDSGKKKRITLELYSDEHAENLALELFKALETNNEIVLESFQQYFESKADAKEAFAYFDRDDSGSVTWEECVFALKRIYREKRALTDSLGDLSQALGNLNKILYVFSVLGTFVCVFPVYGIRIDQLLPFTSLLLALSFVFGGTAKKAFECIIFIFATHPYDSGDRIIIDEGNFIVKELSILQTTLETDGKIIYVPNGNIVDNDR
jgi:hypothetical protein